jgi:putative serine protease PepD
METTQSQSGRRRVSGKLATSAGAVLAIGAAVIGGRIWGQTAPAGNGAALAAGPVVAAQGGTAWVTQVAQAVRTSVVSIDVSGQAQSGRRSGGTAVNASGTGVLLDNQGDILTNNHVVTLGGSSKAGSIQVALANGKTVAAQIVGQDPASDLAVIRIDTASAAGLTPIKWADSSSILVGEPVVAIGYALDLGGEPTVTTGVVSAVNREIDEPGTTISGAVQTDAAINPGNSGGPLLDANGQVIGINTAGLTGTAGQPAVGINFAISAQTAQPVVQSLVNGGTVTRGYLGVGVGSVDAQGAQAGRAGATQGALIGQVSPGSPAAQAGLQTGDIVVKVGSTAITNPGDLTSALTQNGPGSKVTVTFSRNGSQQTAQVTVGQRPNG